MIDVFEDGYGYVRSVKLLVNKTRNEDSVNVLHRPISKIVLLVENDDSPTKEPIRMQDNCDILGEPVESAEEH